MTVSTIYGPVEYDGDASTVDFTVPWMFLESNDLQVTKIADGTGAETAVTTFTTTGAGSPTGGTLTLPAPIPGFSLRIERRTDRTQEMDLQPQGRFPAESLERSVDKLTLIVQELDQGGGGGGGGGGSIHTIDTDTPEKVEIVKVGNSVTINVTETYEDIPGPDLQLVAPDKLVLVQGTGIGSNLVKVPTDFSWASWVDGPTQGGRGIAAGYAWFGDPGSQVHVPVWGANDAQGRIRWTTDFWNTSVEDTSFYTLTSGTVAPPCMTYVEIAGVWCWVLTSNGDGSWWYAQDIAANYNANGSLKTSAWVVGTTAPRLMADIATSPLEGVSCMVGNHGYITRTTDWSAWTDVHNTGGQVIGGIATDNDGTWIAVERDTGKPIRSTDTGLTWTNPTIYKRTGESGAYASATTLIPTGTVVHGNGMWLITGAASYAYSPDGLYWTVENSALGSFYGVGFDGVRYFATNPNNGTNPPVIYQLLVSSIPFHRQTVHERGFASAGPDYFPYAPNIIVATDQNGKVEEARVGDRPIPERFLAEGFVSILDWNAARPTGGTSDQTAGIQAAIDGTPEGWELQIPGGIHRYRVRSQIRIDRRIRIKGVGSALHRMTDTVGVSSPPQFWIPGDVTGIDSMFKIGADPSDAEVRLLNGGSIENISFQCYGSHQNNALIEILGFQWFDIRRCTFYGTSGRVIRGKLWWDSEVQTNTWLDCNRLGDHPELILFDSHPLENCNNIWINGRNQFEAFRKRVVTCALSGSHRMDGLWFRENKIENSVADADAVAHPLFELSGAARVAIEDNTIHRIKSSQEAKVVVKAAATQACEISVQRNSFTELDTTTVLYDLSGPVSLTWDDNRSYNSTTPHVVTNASTRAILYNPIRNSDLANGVARSRPEAIVGPFHSIHRWYGGTESAPFVVDSGTINVEGTALKLSGVSKAVAYLGASLFQGSGCGVRVGVRCRSQTGAGILDFRAGSPLASVATRVVPVGWSTVWWTLNADQVALITSALTPVIETSSTNAENIYIDGLYFLIEPAANLFDAGGVPRAQSMGDGTVAGNTGWTARLTATFAALFGLADPDGTVRWRTQMEDAKDFLVSAFSASPGSAKIDDPILIPNAVNSSIVLGGTTASGRALRHIGPLRPTVTTRTGSATTSLYAESVNRYTGSGGHTETLPGATGTGRIYTFRHCGSGNWTISRAGSDVIDNGVPSVPVNTVVLTAGQTLRLIDAISGRWESI